MNPGLRRAAWLLLWLVVGLVVWLVILEAVHAIAEPSAAVHAIVTTPPGEQQGPLQRLTLPWASDGTSATPAASPALPRPVSPSAAARTPGPGAIGTPEPVDPAPSLASPRAVTRHRSLARYVGIASTYGPLFGDAWVAIPKGPGWRVRVCGPGSCRTLTTTDRGPTIAGRVVDLPVHAFQTICGVPWTRGLCSVSVVILGRAT